MASAKKFIRLQTKFGLGLTVLAILTSALLTASLYLVTQRAVHEGIRRRLHNVVGIAVLQIDGDAHRRIQSREDESSEEYQQIRGQLQRIKGLSPDIRFIQTMRLEAAGNPVFVVDAETDPELFVYVGQLYDTASERFKASADTLHSIFVEPEFYVDEWGPWLTGYAPFYTQDGAREGFLSVDISGDQVRQYEHRFLLIALVIFAAMAAVSPVVGFWVGGRMARSIVKLTEGVRRIAAGDLDSKVSINSRDEVETLAAAFNKMTDELKVYIKNLEETTAAKERIESELRIATEIQASMLPRIFPPFPERTEFDIYAMMEPAKEVGGDFYDFFLINDDKLCFLIGDVAGKGVPASLFMVISKTLLKTEALRGMPPDQVLCQVNNALYPENDACLFVTVFCVILDLKTGAIELANGGHNPPLLARKGKDFEFLQTPRNFVVGPMPEIEYEARSMVLEPDDLFFLYTDGVTEAMNLQSQQFTEKRLQRCLADLREKTVEDIICGLRAEIATFSQGAEQSDDITMIAVKFNGN